MERHSSKREDSSVRGDEGPQASSKLSQEENRIAGSRSIPETPVFESCKNEI
jgi:hypothetical protein